MLDARGEKLVIDHIHLVTKFTNSYYRYYPVIAKEDIESLLLYTLVAGADRWPDYCQNRGFNPNDVQFFPAYITRRLKGAVMDELRALDSVRRKQRNALKADNLSVDTVPGFKMKTYVLVSDTTIDMFEADQAPTPSKLVADEILLEVEKKIRDFPLEDQIIIAMKYYKGMVNEEVAENLGRSASWVSRRIGEIVSDLLDHISSVVTVP